MIPKSLGFVRLVLLYAYPVASCSDSNQPWLLSNMHYMTFTAILFFITILIAMAISLARRKDYELSGNVLNKNIFKSALNLF